MGNCSTEPHEITTPAQQQQQIIPQTEFIKPEPSTFVINSSIFQMKDVYGKQGIKSKITNLSNNNSSSNSNNHNSNTGGQGEINIDQDLQIKEFMSLKKGILFVDHVFKADKKSIGDKLVIDHVQWKRPQQFLKSEPILFQSQLQTYDLKPGRLQNFYLVSAFAALSLPLQRLQQILQQVFNSQTLQPSLTGGYIINLFLDGKWRKILIDDQLPVVFNQYIFSNYRQQLWLWLIQKSLAKYYKSYQNIQKGLLGPMITALTGAPYQYFNIKSKQIIDLQAAWNFIRNNMKQGYNIMTVSTENVDRNQYFNIPANFSYFVRDSQQVFILTSTKKKRQRILKLDNPWGRYQWKGRWSEYSDVWSQQLRHQLDYQKADDSIMWINIQDLVKNFGQICVCKWKQEYISTCLSLKYQQQMESQVRGVYINVTARTQGYLSIVQKDHRHYPNKPYKYSMTKIILLQMQKQPTIKPTKILTQKIDSDHYCTIPLQLNPGLYYLLIDIDWNCSFSREINLQIYADHCVNMEQDKNMPNGDALFYQLAILDQENNQLLEVYVYPHDQNIKRIKGVFGGYVYYHYVNNSKENKYLAQTVKLDASSKNVVIVGEKYPDQYAIKLLPNQQKLVRMKITNQANGEYSFNPVIRNQIFQKFTPQSLMQMLRKKPSKIRQRQIQKQKIEVFVKTFEYSGGVALLYNNNMSQHSYIEEITFETTNLQIENETLQDNCKYNIELQPHGEKMLSFVVIQPSKSYTFKTKIQYYLGTPQFKF